MKASELRIGNFIYNTVNKCEFQIDCFLGTEYCTNKCEFETQEFDAKLEECEPIPLTEEWLLKFGFEKRGVNRTRWTFWKIDLVEDEKGIYSFDESRIYIDIKYVHQLQNIYFALTGEELLLSLPQ